MPTKYLLLLVVLSSCGDSKIFKTCEVPYYKGLSAEFDIDCDYARYVVEKTHEFHIVSGLMTDKEHRTLAGEIYITVKAEKYWLIGGDDRTVNGQYDVFSGITLARDMAALAHEDYHPQDMAHVRLLSPLHTGWYEDGRLGTGDMFEFFLFGQREGYAPYKISGVVPENIRANIRQHEEFGWVADLKTAD